MEHEMKEGLPKTWDKKKRFYEILFPNGKIVKENKKFSFSDYKKLFQ